MHEIKRYEILLEALTPVAHHEATFGNHAVVFTRKFRQHDGSWKSAPYITGDTLRHGLRSAIAYATLDAAGLLETGQLTESALRLLFNGGMITGRGDAGGIRLDQYREMIELVPALGLLGGCASNRAIEGRLVVDDAILICTATERSVPEWMLQQAGELHDPRAHVSQEQRVRMDALLSPEKRKLLSAEAQGKVLAQARDAETAHVTDDAVLREDAKSTMLPRTYEVVNAGSLFAWRVEALCTSELEVDTFHTMVATFMSSARVGGKKATGHGLLRPIAAQGVVVSRPRERSSAVDVNALAPKVGELFRAHLSERKEKIAAFLRTVNA